MAKFVRKFFRLKNSSYSVNEQKDKKKTTTSHFLSTKQEKRDGANANGTVLRSSSLPHIPALNNECTDKRISIYSDSNKYKEGEHWRKEQILGCGQFGACYQALDVVTGTLMAVKQVPIIGSEATNSSSLKEEIELLGRLNHKNIVRILGATQERTHFNIFLEWMPGGSVSSLLTKFGSFHEYVIIQYLKQVLTGLEYLHDNHLIHRDLKGANILVDGTGKHVRISDFGTAGCLNSHVTGEGEFEGQVLGTLPFMAPEVIRGHSYGRSSDIWSVGCVIIEMATASHPWCSETTPVTNYFQLMYKIARAPAPPLVPLTLSSSTRSLAHKCLKLEPNKRPSAKELLLQPVFAIPTRQISIPSGYQSRSSSDLYISDGSGPSGSASASRPTSAEVHSRTSIDSQPSDDSSEDITQTFNFQVEESIKKLSNSVEPE